VRKKNSRSCARFPKEKRAAAARRSFSRRSSVEDFPTPGNWKRRAPLAAAIRPSPARPPPIPRSSMIYHRHRGKVAFRWRFRSKLTQPIYGTRGGEENRIRGASSVPFLKRRRSASRECMLFRPCLLSPASPRRIRARLALAAEAAPIKLDGDVRAMRRHGGAHQGSQAHSAGHCLR